MGQKRRKAAAHTQQQRMRPPLSAEAEAAFYALEGERGISDEFWKTMGHGVDRGAAFPPHKPEAARPNNRASNWNGTFSFRFVFQQADAQTQEALLSSLTDDYHCEFCEGGAMLGQWEGQARLNGKRVKRLTRLLNRHYAQGHLVWREG